MVLSVEGSRELEPKLKFLAASIYYILTKDRANLQHLYKEMLEQQTPMFLEVRQLHWLYWLKSYFRYDTVCCCATHECHPVCDRDEGVDGESGRNGSHQGDVVLLTLGTILEVDDGAHHNSDNG